MQTTVSGKVTEISRWRIMTDTVHAEMLASLHRQPKPRALGMTQNMERSSTLSLIELRPQFWECFRRRKPPLPASFISGVYWWRTDP
jgi:hypothetical protein